MDGEKQPREKKGILSRSEELREEMTSSLVSGPLDALRTPPGTNLGESQGPRIIATCATLIVLSSVAVVLRFVARQLSRAGLWWDDWTILAALVRIDVLRNEKANLDTDVYQVTSWAANICMFIGMSQ